jgi:hypothetical protein
MIKTTLYCLVCLAFLLGLAGTAVAAPNEPPLQNGGVGLGWGHDCGNWVSYYDSWDSGWICYDPDHGPGGDGWINCSGGTDVVWPGLDIELWVEMECYLTWDHTRAQIHRTADFNDFCLLFHGTSSCNNGQYIITTGGPLGSLDYMSFVGDMLGRTTGPNIPASWEYSMDGSGYAPMTTDGADKYFLVEACDHNFTIAVCLDMIFHQPDGYYQLGGDGYCICPATPL